MVFDDGGERSNNIPSVLKMNQLVWSSNDISRFLWELHCCWVIAIMSMARVAEMGISLAGSVLKGCSPAFLRGSYWSDFEIGRPSEIWPSCSN